MENKIDAAMKAWKNLTVPLVIWGGAKCARRISDMLDKKGIRWETYAVSKEYYKETEFNENVVILEDYLEHNCCVLVVAFSGYHKALLDKMNKQNIVNVYALDFIGRFVADNDSLISQAYLAANLEKMELLKAHLGDTLSYKALDDFVHQKMYGEYEKQYSRTREYFEPEIIKFEDNECFVDCGGFDGLDTEFFLNCMDGKNAKAYIFEPDSENYRIVQAKFANNRQVTMLNCAVSNIYTQLKFASNRGDGSRIDENGDAIVEANKLDDIMGDENVTFIKMDIEGFELLALYGAKELIKRCRPKLAICIYHKKEDLFTIPQYILSIHEDYKLYIRNYRHASTDTVLYAI